MEFDLVFEGGGAKGFVFMGALEEFLRHGHTPGRLMGTSAGAISAVYLAAGYDAAEMLAVLQEKVDGKSVFTRFMGEPAKFSKAEIDQSVTRAWLRSADIPLLPESMENQLDDWIVNALLKVPLYDHMFSFVERGGWFSADAFVDWLTEKLNTGQYKGQPRRFGGMTLKEFYDATGVDLSLVASDITAGRQLVLNHRTAPGCPLVWAVRMSMSIPLLWQEVIWQAAWGPYHNKDIAGHAVVDGGVLSNFPIELFITADPMWTAIMGPKQHNHLIGLLIDDNEPVPGVQPGPPDVLESGPLTQLRTLARVRALVDTMLATRDKFVIESYAQFVLRLPAKGYGTTEFAMTDERRNAIVTAGTNAMRSYLEVVEVAPPLEAAAAFGMAPSDFTRQADAVAQRILGE